MKRRKHYEEIIAWANGHEIELKHFNSNGSVWKIDENPTWNEEYTYRIHNPLKEVKEAFEKGDWIIDRSYKGLKAIKFNGESLPYLFSIISTTAKWCYAKKEEIDLSKKYIPFTWEDRELLRGKWIKSKPFGDEELIVQLDSDRKNWIQTNYKSLSPIELLENYTFLDGTPCGKLQ